MPTDKFCAKCRKVKSVELFYESKNTSDGFSSWCRLCYSEYHKEYSRRPEVKAKVLAYSQRPSVKRLRHGYKIKHAYGMKLEDYEALLESQHGCCAICCDPLKEGRAKHVDHDHQTGVVRGILCSGCNLGIGHFREDPVLLDAAKGYLTHHRQRKVG